MQPPPATGRAGLHLQVSSLLLSTLLAAAASTVALIVVAVLGGQPGNPPANPSPGGPPPPPPAGEAPLIITAAIFVVTWVMVAFALCRDHVLRRVNALEDNVMAMRADFAMLRGEFDEYAELRETDGYLHGRRSAQDNAGHGNAGHGNAEVRPLHRVPPAD